LQMRSSVCIEAPAAAVWERLADLESIHLWVGSIRSSQCPTTSRGVGAVRICEVPGATVRETIEEWIEGRSFRYRGEGAPMMERATNTWTVDAYGSKTLVTSTAEVVVKWSWFGRLMEPLLKPFFVRLGTESLAALKFLIENGRPYSGPARRLLPIPKMC